MKTLEEHDEVEAYTSVFDDVELFSNELSDSIVNLDLLESLDLKFLDSMELGSLNSLNLESQGLIDLGALDLTSFQLDIEPFQFEGEPLDISLKHLFEDINGINTVSSDAGYLPQEPEPLLLKPNSTIQDVVDWMLEQVETEKILYQSQAVRYIQKAFGEKFTYLNGNSNLAISKDVLKVFRAVSIKTIVWNRRKYLWRPRKLDDPLNCRAVSE
jgi:hypothetical protein